MNLTKIKSLIFVIITILISSLLSFTFNSCKPKQNIPDWVTDTPTLKFVNMTGNNYRFTDPNQLFSFFLVVYDKDQDIGTKQSDTTVIMKDYRNDSLYAEYRLGFPAVDKTLIEKGYLEAGIEVKLPPGVLRPRPDPLHISTRKDTCYYMISVVDESGKKSNEVKTPIIYISE